MLALALGAGLLAFGWYDVRAFLASARKPPLTFAMTARPGGVRVGASLEFYRNFTDDYVRLENFAALETYGNSSYRHGLGPVCTLEIVCKSAHAKLGYGIGNGFPDQEMVVTCNGQVVEKIDHLAPGNLVRSLALDLHPGSNVVTFTFKKYNHDGVNENAGEPRAIAVTFFGLDLLE